MDIFVQNCKNNNTILNTKDWIEYTDDVKNTLKKQAKKKPTNQRRIEKQNSGLCPTCMMWSVSDLDNYCSSCGQRLDWS